jgi:hypothetical protein
MMAKPGPQGPTRHLEVTAKGMPGRTTCLGVRCSDGKAWQKVRANKGAAGVDGLSIGRFAAKADL